MPWRWCLHAPDALPVALRQGSRVETICFPWRIAVVGGSRTAPTVCVARRACQGDGVYTFRMCRRLRYDKVRALRPRVAQADRGRGRFTNRPYANNGPPMTVQHATFPVGAVREPPVRRGYVFALILARV